jgi:solute carrier family 25 folate transporter 32
MVPYTRRIVRVRLQTYDADSRYKGVRDVVKQGFQKDFTRGMVSIFVVGMSLANQVTSRLGLNIVHVLPSTCVTFCADCILQYGLPHNTILDWHTPRRSS